MIHLFLFLGGLLAGSFLNCIVYRLNHNLSPVLGRSFCPKCKHKLSWYDNIPLLSFVVFGGRCRHCHSPISWQYPLVELVTGLLTVLVVYHISIYDILTKVFYLLVTYALIAIFVSDFLYTTILNQIVFPTLLISLFFLIFQSPNILISNILISLLAAGFFYFLVLITHGRGMGMGDVKLAGLMGLILGWPKILVALYLAFLTGAMVGVILILLGKKRFGQHIPFGPFLAGATILSLFQGDWIWGKIIEVLL